MLSKKLTFSLTSLVMLLALGFAVVPAAFAAIGTEPEVNLEVTDVSSASGAQIEAYAAINNSPIYGETTVTYGEIAVGVSNVGEAASITAINTTTQTGNVVFYLKITNEGVASLDSRGANLSPTADGTVPDPNPNSYVAADPPIASDDLHIHDLDIKQFDHLGIKLSEPINNEGSKIEHRSNAVRDGRNFQITIAAADVNDAAVYMTAQLPKEKFQHAAPADVRAAHFDKDNSLKKNKESGILRIELVKAEPTAGGPKPISLVRAAATITRGADQGGTGVFSQAAVSGPFDVKVTFTEEPNGNIEDIIAVKRGKVTRVIKGTPFYVAPDASEGNYSGNPGTENGVPLTTGRDRRYHSYLLTITPDLKKGDETVEVAVKAFDDMVLPPKRWTTPGNLAQASNRYLLIVPVNQSATKDIFEPAAKDKPSNEKFIPDGLVIPAGGYLVLTQGKADQSGVTDSPAKLVDKKLAAQKIYNVKNEFEFPAPGNDLETLLRVGGTIRLSHADVAENTPAAGATANENGYLVSNTAYTAGSVVISEIMWGRDVSLGDADAVKSQWIELHNPGTADISIDKNEWTLAFYQGSGGTAGAGLIDEVSNAISYWPAPGSSGATKSLRSTDVKAGGTMDKDAIVSTIVETFDLATLTSMYRKIDGANVMSGTSAESWGASTVAGSRNLSANRAGTPGAATPYTTPAAAPEPAPVPKPMAPVATANDLRITEVMVASNDGKLPQWIEIANIGAAAVRLTGWSISIDNDPADADVIAPSVNLKLGDVTIGEDQVALVVSKTGRNSGVDIAGNARTKGDANAGKFDADRIIDVQADVSTAAQYSLISEMAFRISLIPPLPSGVVDRGDVVGNLGQGWELPTSEGNRSSIIRREMDGTTEILGTDEAGWVLASETSYLGGYVETYYGDKDDEGTPGYNAGGALPVELSKFNAKRDPLSGQVIITWETQSELNNAGFYIKRSQQKDSKFVAVNPTMIPGAGTISEKQSYTYTDTTAKPNIVYYYQIEDVSLDGNRQTLTRAHRLKGHIGAAGKATTTWGELKTSLEQ